MVASLRVHTLVALITLTAAPTLAHVPVGTIIGRTNCDTVADLLPPPVLAWVKRGDLTLALGEMRDEVSWEPQFLQASEANAGRYDVDQEGGLIEPTSGQRPPHTYGFPFPRIDPADPKAGVKAMWNATVVIFKVGRAHQPFVLQWIGRAGFERLVTGRVFAIAFDYQPTVVPNPQRTEARDLFQALSPGSVNGIASLTWRYIDNRPDSVWGYIPALRRVRQLTASNRSDPAYGSDIIQDDGGMWFGKNQSFNWKLAGAQDVLVAAATTAHVPLVRGRAWRGGQEWLSPTTYPGARLGWETEGWTGAPWAPANMTWVKRPVWIVEGYPKDSYYSYGRQLFYVDRATFKIYYKVIYTPAGEYWKTLLQDLGIATTEDGERQIINAATIAVDDRARHASFGRGAAPDLIVEYHSAAAVPELFTVPSLMRLGK